MEREGQIVKVVSEFGHETVTIQGITEAGQQVQVDIPTETYVREVTAAPIQVCGDCSLLSTARALPHGYCRAQVYGSGEKVGKGNPAPVSCDSIPLKQRFNRGEIERVHTGIIVHLASQED